MTGVKGRREKRKARVTEKHLGGKKGALYFRVSQIGHPVIKRKKA